MTDKKKPRPKMVVCPACGGRGSISFSTEDTICSACQGSGKVPK